MILFMPVAICAMSATTMFPLIRNRRQGRADERRSNTSVALRLPILSTTGAATTEKTRADALATVISEAISEDDMPLSIR